MRTVTCKIQKEGWNIEVMHHVFTELPDVQKMHARDAMDSPVYNTQQSSILV